MFKSAREKDSVKDIYSRIGDELFSALEIQKRLNSLVRDIEDWAIPGPITLVPTLPGSLFCCSEILKRLRIPASVIPFGIVDNETGAFYLQSNMSGKVLLITDVVDSGKTLDVAGKAIDKYGAEEARVFSLCHKGRVPPETILCHYVGFKIPSQSYVVGSGMDFLGLLSNIQGIRIIKQ